MKVLHITIYSSCYGLKYRSKYIRLNIIIVENILGSTAKRSCIDLRNDEAPSTCIPCIIRVNIKCIKVYPKAYESVW